jgi:exodeoxyribonuclease VIII
MSNTQIVKMTDAEYASVDAVNFSTFKHFLTSPQHYKHNLSFRQEETPAMRLGSAIHTCVLTPEEFDSKYAVAPELDRRRTADKQIWEEFKTILSTDDMAVCIGIQQSFKNNKYFNKLNTDVCYKEHVIVGELFGVKVKGRLDLYDPKSNTIFDVKSIGKSPSVYNCNKAVHQSLYHIQAFIYSSLIKQVAGFTPTFTFGFVEKKQPFAIGNVIPSEYFMNVASSILEKELNRYQNCKLLDKWPSMLHSETPAIISPFSNIDDDSDDDSDNDHIID